MARDDPWVSASDLADYAYCPRAHYYRHHPPAAGPSGSSRRRADLGYRYHERELGGERRREEHGAAYWVAALVGVGFVLGGAWWIFHP